MSEDRIEPARNPCSLPGHFAEWADQSLAGQCKMQARENLDPEYCQFMTAVAERLTSLSAEVERLRGMAPPAAATIVVDCATACLHRFEGKVATMICVADRGHGGLLHDYHRIEHVSIIGGEGEGDGPR